MLSGDFSSRFGVGLSHCHLLVLLLKAALPTMVAGKAIRVRCVPAHRRAVVPARAARSGELIDLSQLPAVMNHIFSVNEISSLAQLQLARNSLLNIMLSY